MAGMGSPTDSTEREVLWNSLAPVLYNSGVLVSTTTDATNTPTTQLRAGLVVGIITASGKLGAYSATATDGRNVAVGVLTIPVNMVEPSTASVADKWCQYLIAGPVRASRLIGLDYAARQQMKGRFIFDDDFAGYGGQTKATIAKTTSYTVLATDAGDVFTTQGAAGAVTFTLPALASITAGWEATFINEAGQNMLVTAPAGKLVCFNNLVATTIAFQTAGELIGSGVRIITNADATKYIALPILGSETATPTIS